MQHLIGGLSFVFIVTSLILILTLISSLSQYQSRKRIRPARRKRTALKPQAKIIVLPRNSKDAPAIVHVKETEAELV
jgi:hypothetical protein